ncbi:Uncharacterised protein [uncultured archaeon]|nr:Uncharacterised protein [uncultured archaeon]
MKESEIGDGLILDNEHLNSHSSVRFYQFIAAVESNFNVIIKNAEDIFTFGDLVKNISSK